MADEKVEGRILQYATLLYHGACSDYRDQYFDSWGMGGVLVTIALATEQAQMWDWEWAARYLLTRDGRVQWRDKIRAEEDAYSAAITAAWNASEAGRTRAQQEGDKVRHEYADPNSDAAWGARDKVWEDIMTPLHEAEKRVVLEQGTALKFAQAIAWAEVYIKEGSTDE